MSFVKNGGFAALVTVLVLAGCVVTLLPKVYWTQNKVTSDVTGDLILMKLSLWQTCTPAGCVTIGHTKEDIEEDIKTEAGAERDGAIAGLVLGGFFAAISLFTICCKSRCGLVILQLLSLIFILATVGCLYRYKSHTLDEGLKTKFQYTEGFFVACATLALSLTASILSCCTNFRSEYDSLNGYSFA